MNYYYVYWIEYHYCIVDTIENRPVGELEKRVKVSKRLSDIKEAEHFLEGLKSEGVTAWVIKEA